MFDEGAQLLLRLGGIEQRVVLNGLLNLVIAFVGGVIGQHIEDETLLDRLFHAVKMKWLVSTLWLLYAEHFQRTVLGGRREGKIRSVAPLLACPYGCENLVLVVLLVRFRTSPHGLVHVALRVASLAAVGFVDDHGKTLIREVRDAIDNEGKLLNRGDDDLLTVLQRRSEIRRAHRRSDDVLHLGEILDVLAQLLVQQAAVGHDDHAIEQRRIQRLRAGQIGLLGIAFNQLVGGPGNRIGFSRSGGVLNQVTLAYPMRSGMGQQLAYHVELVVARKDQVFLRQRVGAFTFQQHEVLDDTGETVGLEHLFP